VSVEVIREVRERKRDERESLYLLLLISPQVRLGNGLVAPKNPTRLPTVPRKQLDSTVEPKFLISSFLHLLGTLSRRTNKHGAKT